MGRLSPICPFSYPLFCERLTSLGSAIQRAASRAQRAPLLPSLGIVRFAIVHDEFHSTEASCCYKHREGWGRTRARGDWMALLCSLTLCTMQQGPKEHQPFVILALRRNCGACVCESSIRRTKSWKNKLRCLCCLRSAHDVFVSSHDFHAHPRERALV